MSGNWYKTFFEYLSMIELKTKESLQLLKEDLQRTDISLNGEFKEFFVQETNDRIALAYKQFMSTVDFEEQLLEIRTGQKPSIEASINKKTFKPVWLNEMMKTFLPNQNVHLQGVDTHEICSNKSSNAIEIVQPTNEITPPNTPVPSVFTDWGETSSIEVIEKSNELTPPNTTMPLVLSDYTNTDSVNVPENEPNDVGITNGMHFCDFNNIDEESFFEEQAASRTRNDSTNQATESTDLTWEDVELSSESINNQIVRQEENERQKRKIARATSLDRKLNKRLKSSTYNTRLDVYNQVRRYWKHIFIENV